MSVWLMTKKVKSLFLKTEKEKKACYWIITSCQTYRVISWKAEYQGRLVLCSMHDQNTKGYNMYTLIQTQQCEIFLLRLHSISSADFHQTVQVTCLLLYVCFFVTIWWLLFVRGKKACYTALAVLFFFQ